MDAIVDERARRRGLLEKNIAQIENTIIDLGYQAEMLQEVAALLKTDKKHELQQIEQQTKELLVGLKFFKRKIADLDHPTNNGKVLEPQAAA